jgi:hypothetical protein
MGNVVPADTSAKTQKLVPPAVAAVLFSLLATGPWSAPTHAAADCIPRPNLKAADGGRWHYRTDRATNRKCWFIRRTGTTIGQAAKAPPPVGAIPWTMPEMPAKPATGGVVRHEPEEPGVSNDPAGRPTDSMPVSMADPETDHHNGPNLPAEPQSIPAELTAAKPPSAFASRRDDLILLAVALLLGALAAGAGLNHWVKRDRARAPDRGTVLRERDYFSVLSRAVADLDPRDGHARRAICERARRVLLAHARLADPPLRGAGLAAEQSALEAAIARLDAQCADAGIRVAMPELADRSFTPRFGSGAKRPSARGRFNEMATWALQSAQRLGRPA